MNKPLCVNVGGASLFGRLVGANVFEYTTNLNTCRKAFAVSADAKKPRPAIFVGASLVLFIYRLGNIAKIANPVVIAHPVFVIYFSLRPLAMNIKPCKPVSAGLFPKKHDVDITIAGL